MIDNKYLKHLIESPLVYYVYQRGSLIYGTNNIESDVDFLVVLDPNYKVPKEFKQYKVPNHQPNQVSYNIVYENCDFIFYNIEDWFKHVLNCEIDAWECACLNKKFIYKEYVKLLMETNPLKLRLNFDSLKKNLESEANIFLNRGDFKNAKKCYWHIIKSAMFTNQILENHKIVNFKEAEPYFNILIETENDNNILVDIYNQLLDKSLCFLRKVTDGIKKKYLIDKFEKQNNE